MKLRAEEGGSRGRGEEGGEEDGEGGSRLRKGGRRRGRRVDVHRVGGGNGRGRSGERSAANDRDKKRDGRRFRDVGNSSEGEEDVLPVSSASKERRHTAENLVLADEFAIEEVGDETLGVTEGGGGGFDRGRGGRDDEVGGGRRSVKGNGEGEAEECGDEGGGKGRLFTT